MSNTQDLVNEQILLDELLSVMDNDRGRAAEICGLLFGDPSIANSGTICKVAVVARSVYIRNPLPDASDRLACIAYLDPCLPSIDVCMGPARVFTL